MGEIKKTEMSIHIRIFAVTFLSILFICALSLAVNAVFNSMLLSGAAAIVFGIPISFIAVAVLRRPYEEAVKKCDDAIASSLSKTNFLATMSREIRTPMNNIVGFSELALDNEISHKGKDYLNKIKTNAQWLLHIINDILDISKVESGKIELENIPFDLHEVFSKCRTLIMPKADEKGIVLYFYIEPSVGKKPLGDPTRLLQVLVNLLTNSVKFTNVGMVKLHAVLKDMSDKAITMYFEVKDSGKGMTPEQIQNIFDPNKHGMGLELAVTRNIIELMGGRLSIESKPGIGSRFSFEIVFDTIDMKSEGTQEKIVLNEIERPLFDGEILLCEDNTMNQQVISEHLARVGLTTVIAENGKIGVDLVKERKDKGKKQFDLVFMDMHMPVMDGLEASARIMELNVGIPIVALTANIIYNDKEIYKKNGMNECVGKPFTSQELWRCLMNYFTPRII
jgi:signal transduction histidine kinase